MNNTTKKTKRTLSFVAVLLAATLVIGSFATTTTTKTAFAASNNSGNTVTAQINRQGATQSGFDNTQEQEAQNTICTHPGNNATCVQEGIAAVTPPPVKLTCEQCFIKFLTSTQITRILTAVLGVTTLEQLCAVLPTLTTEAEFVSFLVEELGLSESAAAQLIQCLKDAGIVFPTDTDSVRTLR